MKSPKPRYTSSSRIVAPKNPRENASLRIAEELQVPASSVGDSLQQLAAMGGDLDLIEQAILDCDRLSKRHGQNSANFDWDVAHLKEIATAADRLRVALSASNAPILDWGGAGKISWSAGAFPPHVISELEELNASLPDRIQRESQSEFPSPRSVRTIQAATRFEARGILRRIQEEARYFSAARKRVAKKPGGRRVRHATEHYWLGLFVPYTASLNKNLLPAWRWIDDWLAIFDTKYPPSWKLWNKPVTDRLKLGKEVRPDLVRIYHSQVNRLLGRMSARHQAEDFLLAADERAYVRAVGKHLPFLKPRIISRPPGDRAPLRPTKPNSLVWAP